MNKRTNITARLILREKGDFAVMFARKKTYQGGKKDTILFFIPKGGFNVFFFFYFFSTFAPRFRIADAGVATVCSGLSTLLQRC